MPSEHLAGSGDARPARASARPPLPPLTAGPAAEWVAERARQRSASVPGRAGTARPGAGGAAGHAPTGPRAPGRDHAPEQPVPQPPAGEGGEQRPLDRIDRAIVRLLQQDGRASVRSVAERVHVSRANAYARIARMVDDGVIRGFTARVDHERAGQAASAYITLKIVQNSWRTVRGQLLELPGVEHIALVSGEFDVLMLVHTVDNRALRELVLNRIQSIPEVLGTHTLLVFDETDRTPVLPD
ncbi:Lrp/AsnC family transcriptional regulator [Streptacidiphilus sp. PB12-B1b]|uniref:Lrp/AsnC family transcriptional regulator n=1 Tax=Streptacidiphilus sp. PB12-B1b TaxID=2705012 RepID=UPI00351A2DC7